MTVTIEQHGCLFSNQSGNKRQHPSGARCFNQIIDAFARGVIMNGLDRIAITRINTLVCSELQR